MSSRGGKWFVLFRRIRNGLRVLVRPDMPTDTLAKGNGHARGHKKETKKEKTEATNIKKETYKKKDNQKREILHICKRTRHIAR